MRYPTLFPFFFTMFYLPFKNIWNEWYEKKWKKAFRIGLILHCRIKWMECILHIEYRINIKKWKVSFKSGDKSIMEEQKKNSERLQWRNWITVILLDISKPGFGTTNDGNTAGRFFSDPQLISQITQVDENLINRFDTKSYVLASGFEINYMTIEQLCTKTAEYCVRLYPWCSNAPYRS